MLLSAALYEPEHPKGETVGLGIHPVECSLGNEKGQLNMKGQGSPFFLELLDSLYVSYSIILAYD
jgi:hypothetical protein